MYGNHSVQLNCCNAVFESNLVGVSKCTQSHWKYIQVKGFYIINKSWPSHQIKIFLLSSTTFEYSIISELFQVNENGWLHKFDVGASSLSCFIWIFFWMIIPNYYLVSIYKDASLFTFFFNMTKVCLLNKNTTEIYITSCSSWSLML